MFTVLMALSASLALAQAPQREAPMVVTNGRIWTGDPANPKADALVAEGGRIVFVGAQRDLPARYANVSPRMNAQDRRIVPGLIDAHVHLTSAASDLRKLNLRDARSREDLLAMLEKFSRELAPDAWVEAARWSSESWPDQRPPTADEIGKAVGGRKAALIRMDGHMLLASRAALEGAGITRGMADPPGGKIGRLEGGEPDGAVYDEAMALVEKQIPPVTDMASRRALIVRALRDANSVGLTEVGAIEPRTTFESLAVLDGQGALTLRVRGTVWDGDAKTVEEWRPALEWAASHKELSPRIRVIGFKGYMDGSLGSRTGWQTAPYLDDPHDPGNAGMPLSMAGNGSLRELILLGASMGLQPAVHAIGDRANHVILGWYEELPAEQRKALRPRVEHAQHLLPEDVARFGALGVVPSMQPFHKADDGRYAEQRLGAERCKTSYAFRGLLDSHAALAFGSDWPIVTENPFEGIGAAVTGRTLDGKTWVPEQSITVEEALRCYTTGAAWALHSETETGMLKAGMAADFVMLDHDLLTCPPGELAKIRPTMTVLAGTVVFRAEAAQPVNPAPAPR